MAQITSRPVHGIERPIQIYYPDGVVGKANNLAEAALIFNCSKRTIARSLATGEPVKRGPGKDVVFKWI